MKTVIFLLVSFLVFLSTESFSQDTTDYSRNFNSHFYELLNTNSEENRKYVFGEMLGDLLYEPRDRAIRDWERAFIVFDSLNYFYWRGFYQYFLGILQTNQGVESYYALERSLNECRKAKDLIGEAEVLRAFGHLHSNNNNYSISIDYYKKSAKLFKTLKSTFYELDMYRVIGEMYAKNNEFLEAKHYLNIALKSFNNCKDTIGLMDCFRNLSEVYRKENKLDSAIWYYNLACHYGKTTFKTDDLSCNDNLLLGELYLLNDDLELARPFLTSANEIYDEGGVIMMDDWFIDERLFRAMALYSQKTGDSNQAAYYINRADSVPILIRGSNPNQLKLLQLENESKAEREKKLLFTSLSVAGFVVLLIIIIAFYIGYKHKQKANRLLAEMDELKTRLYSNITHELRTPLTLILGPLEKMITSGSEKTPSRKQVKIMQKNANSLLNLVNQMLDLTKIDAKSMKLELVEEDINKFLRTRFAAFASLAEQKSITYQCSLMREKNVRIFDSSKLEKIINNLISNAIKFTGDYGKISCYANFQEPEILELVVQDDGEGIPKDEIDKIFDRFHQVKTNAELITLGTGIGLSLTKELVELMHGKIEVESEVGRGSKFVVTLPLGIEHLNSDEFQMIKSLNSGTHKNVEISKQDDFTDESDYAQDLNEEKQKLPFVLIVEDNIDIREFISDNLSDSFVTEKVGNGQAGLKRAIENIPDLVITDIVMPKMDGIELCNNLKTDERTSHIPVVMLTGKSSIDDRLKGLDIGADAYLTKPFNIKELRLQVVKLIEQRQKLRERFTRDLRLEPKDIAVTSMDEKFIIRAMEVIEKNLSNSDYEINQFQDEMFMSRTQLFRKIKALTNQTPAEFIQTIRLKRAASLIKQNFGNMAQITYEVGFKSPSYFAKCFKELYGVLPSNYLSSFTSSKKPLP